MKMITSFWGKKPSHVTRIIIGDIYECQPTNPAAKKNRGRRCVLISYGDSQQYSDYSHNATVKWVDTNRKGYVDISNFIHADDMKKTPEQRALEAKEHQDNLREAMLQRFAEEHDIEYGDERP